MVHHRSLWSAATMYSDKRRRKLYIQVQSKRVLTALSYILAILVGFLLHVQISVHQCSDRFANSFSAIPTGSAKVDAVSLSREYGDGWNSIEVFYGKTKYFEEKNQPHLGTAQAKQDVIVSLLFGEKTNGYFLDLAANDAVWISNTYFLEKKFNWTGLCLEPNPAYWFDLAHRKCQVVAAVVGGIRNDAVIFQKTSDGALGGIVGDGFDNHDETGGEVRYTVPLYEVLNRFQAPKVIDYLSLDVEGAETLIMKDFPFHEYSFNVMTVERPKDDLKALFEKFDYELVARIGLHGETLWVRKAYRDSLNIASVEEFFIR
jgi:Methyltransferase FkbM domain